MVDTNVSCIESGQFQFEPKNNDEEREAGFVLSLPDQAFCYISDYHAIEFIHEEHLLILRGHRRKDILRLPVHIIEPRTIICSCFAKIILTEALSRHLLQECKFKDKMLFEIVDITSEEGKPNEIVMEY